MQKQKKKNKTMAVEENKQEMIRCIKILMLYKLTGILISMCANRISSQIWVAWWLSPLHLEVEISPPQDAWRLYFLPVPNEFPPTVQKYAAGWIAVSKLGMLSCPVLPVLGSWFTITLYWISVDEWISLCYGEKD